LKSHAALPPPPTSCHQPKRTCPIPTAQGAKFISGADFKIQRHLAKDFYGLLTFFARLIVSA